MLAYRREEKKKTALFQLRWNAFVPNDKLLQKNNYKLYFRQLC